MIRLVHTADWQMGMRASGLGKAAQVVREARVESLRGLVEISNKKGAELLLVTGDVFEDNAVDRLLVRTVGEWLRKFHGQVFIIPGNHDPLVPGSVWDHPVWKESENVTVIRENQPIELPNCVLYPCPLHEKYSTRSPVSWIQAQACQKVAIGMAHGNVEGLPGSDPEYPIAVRAAETAGLDYLGIGHWHSYTPYQDSQGAIRMAYCGTHETTKFAERKSGQALLVEIEGRGAAPRIELLRTGKLSWHAMQYELERAGELREVVQALDAVENPQQALVRVRLSGLLFAADKQHLESIHEILQTRFLFGVCEGNPLKPAPDDDLWVEELPVGVLRETAEQMRQQALQAGDERQQAVATQALLELFAIKEKVVP